MRHKIVLATFAILATSVAFPVSATSPNDWDQAVAAFKAGDHDSAVAGFKSYVERMPNAYQGHQMLGTALLKAGDPHNASIHLARADELEPDQPMIVLALAKSLVESNETSAACTTLDRLTDAELDARQTRALYGLRATAACGDHVATLHGLAAASNSAKDWARYGVAALEAGDHEAAVEALDRAASMAPDDARIQRARAQTRLAAAHASTGENRVAMFEAAVGPARSSWKLNQDTAARTLYVDALIGARDLATAAETLSAALKEEPDAWSSNYLMGRVQVLDQKYAKAVPSLERALRLAEAHGSKAEANKTLELLGFAYEMNQAYDNAIKTYKRLGDTEALERAQANRDIAAENADAEDFNRRRAELIAAQEAAAAELEAIRSGGPPPTPN